MRQFSTVRNKVSELNFTYIVCITRSITHSYEEFWEISVLYFGESAMGLLKKTSIDEPLRVSHIQGPANWISEKKTFIDKHRDP